MKIEFKSMELSEATKEEIKEEEEYWKVKKYYCPTCRQSTLFGRCTNCYKRFCLNHAYEEEERLEGHLIASYKLCYHCHLNDY